MSQVTHSHLWPGVPLALGSAALFGATLPLSKILLDRPFIIFGATAVAQKFLATLKDFPPSQAPGSFNLDAIMRQMQERSRSEN